MRYLRTLSAAMAGAVAFTSLTAVPILAQDKGGGDAQPLLLSLAVWDHPGRQAAQAALDLVALAPELSGGAITVEEPVWGAADAAELVRSGQVDLAILATREWSPLGVTSLDALEAPFLIDNDALADAVAQSDIADAAMSGLEDLGITGLTMWPEDLRHVFAFEPFGRAFQSPQDFVEATILAIAGLRGQDLVTTLGGELYQEGIETNEQTGVRDLDSASGVLDGMVTGLWGAGLSADQINGSFVAADVVLYPKFQLLVGNRKSLARLTDDQLAALDDIAVAVQQRAIERRSGEIELAAGICEQGGTVMAAGAEAVSELRKAARPLLEAMAADPDTGELITRITALSSEVESAPTGGPCEIGRAGTEPSVSDTTGFLATLPPDGVYRADVSYEDLVARGVSDEWARNSSGIFTITILDGTYAIDSPEKRECRGRIESLDKSLFLTDELQGCAPGFNILWRPEGDGVAIVVADPKPPSWSTEDFTNIQSHLGGRTWTKIDGPMPPVERDTVSDQGSAGFTGSEPVPDGTYRTLMTASDLQAAGAGNSYASINDGTWTLTVDGDRWSLTHTGNRAAPSQPEERCEGTHMVDGDRVRFATVGPGTCGFDYDVRWNLDGDALSLQLVDLTWSDDPAAFAEEQTFIDRVWTRIDGPSSSAPADALPPVGTSGPRSRSSISSPRASIPTWLSRMAAS